VILVCERLCDAKGIDKLSETSAVACRKRPAVEFRILNLWPPRCVAQASNFVLMKTVFLHRWPAIFLLCTIAHSPLNAATPTNDTVQRYDWQRVIADLRTQQERLNQALKRSQIALIPRAKTEDPSLVKRLDMEPAYIPGYGKLPDIKNDARSFRTTPKKAIYSLEKLQQSFAKTLEGAVQLDVAKARDTSLTLISLVEAFERLKQERENLEEQLAYHEYWQQAVADYKDFFVSRNNIIKKFVELEQLRDAGVNNEHQFTLEHELEGYLTTFTPTTGLEIKQLSGNSYTLPINVYTDIEDDDFLLTFQNEVELLFNRANAALGLRISIELQFKRISPTTLYPQRPPAYGDNINLDDHLQRFPKEGLILTTGAMSTHAWTGRSVALGPTPITRRTLVHEFAHLLGFDDAYLRGFEGDIDDPYGVIIIEWTGLSDDLMGNPEGGELTEKMFRTLIDAYKTN